MSKFNYQLWPHHALGEPFNASTQVSSFSSLIVFEKNNSSFNLKLNSTPLGPTPPPKVI